MELAAPKAMFRSLAVSTCVSDHLHAVQPHEQLVTSITVDTWVLLFWLGWLHRRR